MIAADALNFLAGLPEIFLACGAMTLLMIGVFRGDGATAILSWLAVGVLVATAALVAGGPVPATAFAGVFVTDSFGVFMKLLVLTGAAFGIVM